MILRIEKSLVDAATFSGSSARSALALTLVTMTKLMTRTAVFCLAVAVLADARSLQDEFGGSEVMGAPLALSSQGRRPSRSQT